MGSKTLSMITVSLLSLMMLTGCNSMTVDSSQPIKLNQQAKVAVLPFLNHTQTPRAGMQAKAITEQLLQDNSQQNLYIYALQQDCGKLLACPPKELDMDAIKKWAAQHHIRYAYTGTVNEWRYKTGLEGRPAVNMTLTVLQFPEGKAIWRGVGTANGSYYASIGSNAQSLVKSLITQARGN